VSCIDGGRTLRKIRALDNCPTGLSAVLLRSSPLASALVEAPNRPTQATFYARSSGASCVRLAVYCKSS
jgi:hypothetical protein